jgi:hypothetical protein
MKIDKRFQAENVFTIDCPECKIEQELLQIPFIKLPFEVQTIILQRRLYYQVVQCPKCKVKAIQMYD